VVNGPGSFTGIRVGLSTAKGLAHAMGMPVVAVSRLFVLAGLTAVQSDFLAVLDAGRNEFYTRRGEREWLASFEEIESAAAAGNQLVMAEERMAKRFAQFQPELVGLLDAAAAARAAVPRLRAGIWENLATLDANYLRRSDAELFARSTQ
jgi:tRNA threonylcarbamoyladenosine biosynthesis protein TsaB